MGAEKEGRGEDARANPKKISEKLNDSCADFQNPIAIHSEVYYNDYTQCGGKWSESVGKCLIFRPEPTPEGCF